jgi:integrase
MGRWSAAAYVLRQVGGRVRRQVYGCARAEASQKLTVMLSKTAAGIPLGGRRGRCAPTPITGWKPWRGHGLGTRWSIPLPESRAALLSHRERQEVERLAAGDSWQESGPVFNAPVGAVVEPRNLRTFAHLVQRSGVRRIRFHDHDTRVHRCFWRRVSPRVVMEMLGHFQLSITMDVYSHMMPNALRDAADAMDRPLNEGR